MKAFTCATCAHFSEYVCRFGPPIVVLSRAEMESGNVGQAITNYEPQTVFPRVADVASCGQWTSPDRLRATRLAQLPKYGDDGDSSEEG